MKKKNKGSANIGKREGWSVDRTDGWRWMNHEEWAFLFEKGWLPGILV